MKHIDHIRELFQKFLLNDYTEEEFRQLQTYFDTDADEEAIKQLIYNGMTDEKTDEGISDHRVTNLLNNTDKHLLINLFQKERLPFFKRKLVHYAAAVLTILLLGLWSYKQLLFDKSTEVKPEVSFADVSPGKNQATLQLADGSKVQLSDTQQGIVVSDGVSYVDGSSIPLSTSSQNPSAEMTVSTPNGGTYQVTLSDGTKVWLNTSSTLQYPIRFNEKERIVHLSGEAYFEVKAHQKAFQQGDGSQGNINIPFKVITDNQTVTVLGTAFNVSAYKEKQSVYTTLVSGSVEVWGNQSKNRKRLNPGQQSLLEKSDIHVREVDTRNYTAWKDGVFYFNRTPLIDAMDAIGRWYDVDVVYQQSVSNTLFYGEINRNKPLADVLEMLQEGGVKFHLQKSGKRHIVSVY